ncbi:hypothetical protein KL908_004164 [Ogataea polymorpha]|nr:hypothetical protein KL908_004164 [Ogataea polymorpha]
MNHTTTKTNPGKYPRFLALGGDHTVTYSGIRAAFEKYGKVSVLHFDAHLDTVDPYYMNPNVTDYAALNHGTYLYWAHRKGDYTESKFSKIMARDIDKIDGIIEKIKKQLGDCPVYISFDIDVVDSASAPATGSIEAGGWSSREILSIIDGLAGINLVGADIAEVSPWGDLTNDVASNNAGEAGRAILGLMVIKPVICDLMAN